MASTHLTRTFGSATTQQTWTMSFWVKRGKLGVSQFIAFCTGANSNNNWLQVGFNNDDRFILSGYSTAWLKTTRLFRDPSAWYHIVVQADSPQSTASNRLKVYVNGVEETSFETDNRSSITQSQTWGWNRSDGYVHYIGSEAGSGYFDGSLSHFHFSDGSIIAPTVFGSTDATTGEWKINTSPSFTLGNNGFTILKDGNTVTDQSTNSNNWTVANGTLTKTQDCPSNVFATFNPLDNGRSYSGTIDLKNGNTTQQNGSDASLISTLGMKTGKWYAEFKIINAANTRTVGIIDISESQGYIAHGSLAAANSYGYKTNGQSLWSGTTEVATNVGEGVAGDIISVAIDLDSATKTIKWQRNGSDLSGTTSINISQSDVTWAFFVRADGGQTMSANFGNGYFGTTAVATNSGNGYSGAEGKSIFNYQPPTGYSALSTKGLNE